MQYASNYQSGRGGPAPGIVPRGSTSRLVTAHVSRWPSLDFGRT